MSDVASLSGRLKVPSNYYDYLAYGAMHLACLGVLWVGISWKAVAICLISYFFRMFGLIAGYHRYFSHRSYKMSRPVQFLMALLGSLAVQKGVLWWAETHRHHHRFPDEPEDIHSPITRGFLYSHSGWFLDQRHRTVDLAKVPDLARYPELVWLNDWNLVPVALYALSLLLVFGWEGLVWGFFVSTILIWHAIHSVGSFGHKLGGYRRYPTTDNSRNKWFLALTTLGEGWHNNHHYYPASARQGFFWYEYDIAYYLLKAMSWLGLVSELKTPPEQVKRGEMPGYQRRLRAFKMELIEFRRELTGRIDAAVADDGGELSAEHRGVVTTSKEWMAERIDAFDEAAYTLLIRGPLEMTEAFFRLRDEVVAGCHQQLAPLLGPDRIEALATALAEDFERFTRRPKFLGKKAA